MLCELFHTAVQILPDSHYMAFGRGGRNMDRWASDLIYKFKNHFKIIKPGQYIFIYTSRVKEKTTKQHF